MILESQLVASGFIKYILPCLMKRMISIGVKKMRIKKGMLHSRHVTLVLACFNFLLLSTDLHPDSKLARMVDCLSMLALGWPDSHPVQCSVLNKADLRSK